MVRYLPMNILLSDSVMEDFQKIEYKNGKKHYGFSKLWHYLKKKV